MHTSQTPSFGKLSMYGACAAIIAAVLFFFSGPLLSPIAVEQTIVIVQLTCAFAVPLFALIGFILGIISIVRERPTTLGIIGTVVNACLLIITGIILAMLIMATSSIEEASETSRLDVPSVQIDVE